MLFRRCSVRVAQPPTSRFRDHDLFAPHDVDDGGIYLQFFECEIIAENPGPVIRQSFPEHSLPICCPDVRPPAQLMRAWIAAEHLRGIRERRLLGECVTTLTPDFPKAER